MKKNRLLKVLLLALLLTVATYALSCKKKPKETAKDTKLILKPADATPFFEPLYKVGLKNLQVVEIGSDNIAIWAKKGVRNTTLILVDSMINIGAPIPDDLLLEAKGLIDSKNDELLTEYTGLTNKLKRLYDPFNYVYAANRLGIIKDVIWVLPYPNSLKSDYLDYFKEQLKKGFNANSIDEDLKSFSFIENRIEGKLFGIPITVVTIDDLKVPSAPVVMSIDLSYLASFVTDNVKTPIEDITVSFLNSLSKKPLMTNYVTIVNSNKTFRVTMQFRFISNILKALLQNPGLMGAPKNEWIMKQEADRNFFFIEYDKAEEIYNEILKITPDDPAIYYQLALVNEKQSKYEQVSYYIEEAAKRDENYLIGYIDISSKIQKEDTALKLLNFGYENHKDNVPILSTMGGLLYKKGKFQEALEVYLKLLQSGIESYELNFYVADCYFNLGSYEKAKEMYNNTFSLLTEDYKNYYSFYYINLAETYKKLNDNENAIKNYELFLKHNKNSPEIKSIEILLDELKSAK